MGRRRDALAAGSDIVLGLEQVCTGAENIVGTVGRVEVFPNSLNVVPGRMALGMEMRGLEAAPVEAVARAFADRIDRIRGERDVAISFEFSMSSRPVHFPGEMAAVVREVAEALGVPYLELASGAGHDAGHLAGIGPAAMIFVPSKDGRSHCADEWTDFGDIATGTEVLGAAIRGLDRRQTA